LKIFTKKQKERLLKNGEQTIQDGIGNHVPVVKLFMPSGGQTWLLTELDPNDHDHAFGLCDLGFGEPELGYVSIEEITSTKGPYGLHVERDRLFEGTHPIGVYARAARQHETIVEDPAILDQFEGAD
jgi:hypothetical protein